MAGRHVVAAREEEAGEREDLCCRAVPGEVCTLLGLLTLPVAVLLIKNELLPLSVLFTTKFISNYWTRNDDKFEFHNKLGRI